MIKLSDLYKGASVTINNVEYTKVFGVFGLNLVVSRVGSLKLMGNPEPTHYNGRFKCQGLFVELDL